MFPCQQELLNSNIALNTALLEASGGLAVAFPLVWGETDCSRVEQQWVKPDLVVAADVIYHRELMTPLLETVRALGELSPDPEDIYAIRLTCFPDQAHRIWIQGSGFLGRVYKLFCDVQKLSVLKDSRC